MITRLMFDVLLARSWERHGASTREAKDLTSIPYLRGYLSSLRLPLGWIFSSPIWKPGCSPGGPDRHIRSRCNLDSLAYRPAPFRSLFLTNPPQYC